MDAPTATIVGAIITASGAMVVGLITSRATIRAARIKEEKKDEAKRVVRDRGPAVAPHVEEPTETRQRGYVLIKQGSHLWSDLLSIFFYVGPVAVGFLYYFLDRNFPTEWTAVIWTTVGLVVFVLGLIILGLLEHMELEKLKVRR